MLDASGEREERAPGRRETEREREGGSRSAMHQAGGVRRASKIYTVVVRGVRLAYGADYRLVVDTGMIWSLV